MLKQIKLYAGDFWDSFTENTFAYLLMSCGVAIILMIASFVALVLCAILSLQWDWFYDIGVWVSGTLFWLAIAAAAIVCAIVAAILYDAFRRYW
jgi:hypothetical protein